MANPNKIFVLDLGMQSIRMAEFSSTQDGLLKLLRGAKRDLILDPALEASRPEQITLNVADILKEWKTPGGDVICVLASHTVFTRVVPLDVPGGDPGQIDAVVQFEAQQNIPFPLEEVVWDYVVLGSTPAGAVNVVFVAVKTDVMESLCHAVSSSGLRIKSVSVAPLALYDAFRLTSHGAAEEPMLMLDFGSRTTNMLIVSGSSFYSRSIPTGGLSITTAIGKDLNIDLDQAELLKLQRGSVALGAGFEPPADPVEANLAKIARQTLIKAQADITRSLSYYRSTLGGSDPATVLVTGGMSLMPYLAEFLSERLQKQLEFFNPLERVGISEQALPFVEANPGNMGELVGGALALIPGSGTSVNLLPPSVLKKQALAKLLPYLGGTAALLLVSILSWALFAHNAAQFTVKESDKIKAAVADESRVADEMKKLQTEEATLLKKSEEFSGLIAKRQAYPKILAELAAKIPDRYLWITEIQASVDTQDKPSSPTTSTDAPVKAIIVKGLYLDNPRQASVVDEFVTALQGSSIFLVEENEKSKVITQRSSPSGEFWAYPFELRIPLRTPITPIP